MYNQIEETNTCFENVTDKDKLSFLFNSNDKKVLDIFVAQYVYMSLQIKEK